MTAARTPRGKERRMVYFFVFDACVGGGLYSTRSDNEGCNGKWEANKKERICRTDAIAFNFNNVPHHHGM
jgi:hypothetical protein